MVQRVGHARERGFGVGIRALGLVDTCQTAHALGVRHERRRMRYSVCRSCGSVTGAHMLGVRLRLDEEVMPARAQAIDALLAEAPNGHFSQHPGWLPVLPRGQGDRYAMLTGEAGGALAGAGLGGIRPAPLGGGMLGEVVPGAAARLPGGPIAGPS